MKNAFDWVPFYGELADKLVPFRSQQSQLIAFLQELRANGVKTTPIEDQDETGARFTLTEIDPFTFFGSFNRGTTSEMRISILTAARKRFSVNAAVPSHFSGIPILNNQNSWFFSYQHKRRPGDMISRSCGKYSSSASIPIPSKAKISRMPLMTRSKFAIRIST